MKALILIAHGSRKQLSNNEFKTFVEVLSLEDTKYSFIKAAFLELANPSIEEMTEELINEGMQEIYYYPYFLNSGKHILIDIPQIIEKLQAKYKNINLKLLPHFGKSEKIKNIVLQDINI